MELVVFVAAFLAAPVGAAFIAHIFDSLIHHHNHT